MSKNESPSYRGAFVLFMHDKIRTIGMNNVRVEPLHQIIHVRQDAIQMVGLVGNRRYGDDCFLPEMVFLDNFRYADVELLANFILDTADQVSSFLHRLPVRNIDLYRQ